MANKKRFTFFTDDYPAVTCDYCYEDQNENYTGPAIDRLAEYEATGLMPAEVAALAQELKYAKQQCREERRWISVKARLPEAGGYVVCIAKRNPFSRFIPMVARIEKNGWVNPITEQYISEVTHWMPLPEPPKGD